MKHTDKKKLARRLREQEANRAVNNYKEQKFPLKALQAIHRMYMKMPVFQTKLWEERRENRAVRVRNREALAQQRHDKTK